MTVDRNMRCLVFETDPVPKFYREFENLPMNQLPVDMLGYYPDQNKWHYRTFYSGRAGHPPWFTMPEEYIHKEILAMVLLLT